MLTNDEKLPILKDLVPQAVDELLSLQSLPEMAEVDAEYEGCFDGADHAAVEGVKKQ